MNDKQKPSIRFKGFTEAWEQRKFSDITFLAGEKNKENIPYESYSVTNEHGFIPQNEQFENGGTMATADKSMYYIVSKNSFAYNPARINVGSIGYYDKPENVIVSSLYEVFKTVDDIDDRFLWHWFKSDAFQKMIEQYQEGGVRLYFYYDKLCMCSLSIPSLREQQKIGKQLDTLDHLITLHQRKYDKLVNVKKSMLEKMFPRDGKNVPEIRFSGFTEAWEQRKLGDITESYSGGTPTAGKKEYYDGNIPFIRSGEISDDKTELFISEEGLNSSSAKMVKIGDVLYALYGATSGEVSISKLKGAINQAILAIQPHQNYDSQFLMQWLRKSKENIIGTYLQGGQGNLSGNIVKELIIDVPIYEEQKQIGEYFRNLDNLITLHQREVEKLQNIKKSCLEKMFV